MYNSSSKETEAEVRARRIDPSLINAGWDLEKHVRMEYVFTDGKVILDDKIISRGEHKKADYLLNYHSTNLAIIEAKDSAHSVGAGIQQALGYAETLDVRFVYSSNGHAYLEHDKLTGVRREIPMNQFPSPDELWERYLQGKGFSKEVGDAVSTPYYYDVGGKSPRYYQEIAINRTLEAVASGKYAGGVDRRILLVMATGTGKTFTAFQIIHRLRAAGLVKKVLYLADRNVLIDQTLRDDFAPFKKLKIITKVEKKQMESAYDIFMSLYQQQVGTKGEEDTYKEFSPDFFDLILVDECHRGSAKEDSNWRKILEYFSSAIQIGMTATPKETKDVSNIDYFGTPLFTYSLRQGIDDGFLAPYKVLRVHMDKDIEGYATHAGQTDDYGNEMPQKVYGVNDYDKTLVLTNRRKTVAKRITQYLKETDRFSKTIVFCDRVEHANEMVNYLVNENSDLVAENPKYIMQITGDDIEGQKELDNFQDVNSKYPVIAVTSDLLSTGVNVKLCKVIALDRTINSLTTFRQILGRGTRLYPEKNKWFFTVIDFKGATKLLQDPDFDGEPVSVKVVDKRGQKMSSDEEPRPLSERPPVQRFRLNDVSVEIVYEKIQIIGSDGKPITESFTDVTRKQILRNCSSQSEFVDAWNTEDKSTLIKSILDESGEEILAKLRQVSGLYDIDDFDLICHVAFDKKPLSKSQRANGVKGRGYLEKYSGEARQVLEILLDKYSTEVDVDVLNLQVLQLSEFHPFGSPKHIAGIFGGRDKFVSVLSELRSELYSVEV